MSAQTFNLKPAPELSRVSSAGGGARLGALHAGEARAHEVPSAKTTSQLAIEATQSKQLFRRRLPRPSSALRAPGRAGTAALWE